MSRLKLLVLLMLVALAAAVAAPAPQGRRDPLPPPGVHMDITEYAPRSTLKVPEHLTPRAKFPFIDIHGHQGPKNASQSAQLVKEMDSLNLRLMNNLSGGFG